MERSEAGGARKWEFECVKIERSVIGGGGGLLYLIIEAIPTREKSRKNKFLYVRA